MSLLDTISTILSVANTFTNKSNADTKVTNSQAAWQQQQALQQKQLDIADQMMKMGMATTVDANGNITFYDTKTNTWRSVLSPSQQELNDLGIRESKQQLAIDAPVQRIENLVNATRRSREGQTAGVLKAQVDDQLRTGGYSPTRLASSLRLSRENAVNKGFDDIGSAVITQALRSGAKGGAITDALAKARSREIASTMGNPDLEGSQLADSMDASKLTSLSDVYQMFAGRASNNPQVSYNPTNIGASLSAALQNQRSAQALGLSNAGSIINGINPSIQPSAGTENTSWLNSLSSLLDSDVLGSIFKTRDKTGNSGTTASDNLMYTGGNGFLSRGF
jgi:hypothetical protein